MKFFYLCLLIVLIAYLAAPCKAEGGHGVHRIKRHVCRDGFENFEGRNCCRCSPGYFRKTPCTPSSETVCEPCPGGTYLEHTNFRASCEPCKICDDKANMESKERCNPRQNTICTCQNGYYCDKAVQEECKACHPCKICEKGFEVEKSCTSTNNTVCRKAAEEVGQGWIWIVVSLVLLVIAVAAAVFLYKKKCISVPFLRPGEENQDTDECIPIKDVDLSPHLTYIVEEVGHDFIIQHLARPDMKPTAIEFHEVNAGNNSKEKCYNIMRTWCEQQGLENAFTTLLTRLHKNGKKATAEKIKKKVLESNNI